jgi:hypothetical protein
MSKIGLFLFSLFLYFPFFPLSFCPSSPYPFTSSLPHLPKPPERSALPHPPRRHPARTSRLAPPHHASAPPRRVGRLPLSCAPAAAPTGKAHVMLRLGPPPPMGLLVAPARIQRGCAAPPVALAHVVAGGAPPPVLPTRTLRLAPPRAAGEQGARPPQHSTPRLPPGQGRKSDAEAGGATFSWLHLLCGSRNGLQVRLLGWSRSICTCLAGLRVEPWLELELEPCQTGPKCLPIHLVQQGCFLNLLRVTIRLTTIEAADVNLESIVSVPSFIISTS